MSRNFVVSLAVVLVFALAGSTALAGGGAKKALKAGGADRPRPLQRIHQILDKLDLSAEQTAKITPILDQAESQAQSIRRDVKASGDRSAAKEKVRALVLQTKSQIEAQLTPEQKAKFDDQLKEARADRQAKRNSPPPTNPSTK